MLTTCVTRLRRQLKRHVRLQFWSWEQSEQARQLFFSTQEKYVPRIYLRRLRIDLIHIGSTLIFASLRRKKISSLTFFANFETIYKKTPAFLTTTKRCKR